VPEALVDPAVSRAKFEREVAAFRNIEADQRRRGILVLRAEFPTVDVVFAAAHVPQRPVLFGATLDFSNYDLWPPSIRFVDAFSREPLTLQQLPPFLRSAAPPAGGELQLQQLVQAFAGGEPFLCLQGVREYHFNPAHTGDSWLLHRARGAGTLYFVLEKLHHFGVSGFAGYQIQVQLRPQWGPVE
jgi:hypothetical protein